MRRLCRGLTIGPVIALVALGTAVAVAPQASAVAVSCGQTITQSTLLIADVGPCPGDGVIIGADGITLDLNGHSLTGIGSDGLNAGNDSVGVRLNGRTGAVVRGNQKAGGTIAYFNGGVAISGGSANIVQNLTIQDNVGNEFGAAGDGVVIMDSSKNSVSRNRVFRNGPFDGIGVYGASSRDNSILNNTVEDNRVQFIAVLPKDYLGLPQFADCPCRFDLPFSDDIGINLGFAGEGSNATTVSHNTVRRSGNGGIVACSIKGVPCVSADNTISNNTVEQNGVGCGCDGEEGPGGDGIHTQSLMDEAQFVLPTRNVIADNHVRNNVSSGIVIVNSQNRIYRNTATGNLVQLGEGDLVDISGNSSGVPCTTNVWSQNIFETATPDCAKAGGHGSPPAKPKAGQGRTSASGASSGAVTNSHEANVRGVVLAPHRAS